MKKLKEYQFARLSRTLLDDIEKVLLRLRKYDDGEETLTAALHCASRVFVLNERMKLGTSYYADSPAGLAHQIRWSVLSPIVSNKGIPSGGEQNGNMLCIDDAFYRIEKYKASVAQWN